MMACLYTDAIYARVRFMCCYVVIIGVTYEYRCDVGSPPILYLSREVREGMWLRGGTQLQAWESDHGATEGIAAYCY